MRKLSKAIMEIGGTISVLAMCCLDSNGVYMYYAGLVCILGGFITGAGYGLKVLSERHRRKTEIFFIRQMDRRPGQIEDKKIAP